MRAPRVLVLPLLLSLPPLLGGCGGLGITAAAAERGTRADALVCSQPAALLAADVDDSITGFVVTGRSDGHAEVRYVGNAAWIPERAPMVSLTTVDLGAASIRFDMEGSSNGRVWFRADQTAEGYDSEIFLEDYSMALECERRSD